MATPAAVLSILVKANGIKATKAQLVGLDRAGREAATGVAKTEKAAKGAGAAHIKAAKAVAGFVGAYAAVSTLKSSVKTTEELAKTTISLHKNFGLATKSASEWAASTSARNIESKQLQMGFKTLSSQIVQAGQGTKTSVGLFKALGVSMKELKAHGGNLDWALARVSDGLAKMPAGTSKANVMSKLFGRTWQGLSPLIRDGSKAMNEQLAVAEKYGATMGGRSIDSVKKMVAAQREAKLAMMGLQITIGTTVIPVLTKLIGWMAQFVMGFREGTGAGGRLRDMIASVGAVLAPFAKSIGQIVGWLKQHRDAANVLIPVMAGLAVAIWAVNAALTANPFVLAAVALAALTVGLVTAYRESETFRSVVDAVFGWLRGAATDTFGWVSAAFRDTLGVITSVTAAVVGEVGQWDTLFSAISAGVGIMAGIVKFQLAGIKLAFSVIMLALGPIVAATMKYLQGLFSGAFTIIKGIVVGALGVLRGLVMVFGGLFKGDFGQIWDGIKTIFKSGVGALKTILEGAWKIMKAPVEALAAGIKDAFSHSWDRIKDVFSSAINVVIGFLNILIKAINLIPGVPDIDPIGRIGGGGGGKGGIPVDKKARGGAFARTGGLVSAPITLMGEEAPRWPEYVIPTNPAYRGRAKGLLGQAAGAIGMAAGGKFMSSAYGPPWGGIQGTGTTATGVDLHSNPHILGIAVDPSVIPLGSMVKVGPNPFNTNEPFKAFDTGGAIKGRRIDFYDWRGRASQNAWGMREVTAFTSGDKGSGGGVFDDAASIISKFPNPSDLPDLFKGTGKYIIDKATEWAKKQIAESPGGPVGRFGKPSGPAGTGQFMGLTMADWVIESLKYAQGHGVPGLRPTSGYRSHATNVAAGRMYHSEHEGTQYPHGAVDFGGFNSGLAMKMAVVNATRDFKYPLLAPIGFHDDGHASGTGHARGGVFKYLGGFKHGGITGSDGMAYLHKNEAVIPMKKGGGPIHKPPSYKPPVAKNRWVAGGSIRAGAQKWGAGLIPGARGASTDPSRKLGPVTAATALESPSGDEGDPNQALIDSNAALQAAIEAEAEIERERIRLTQQLIDNQIKVLAMANQGPQILAAVVAAVNGGIGGRVGLGTQSPSYAGGVSRYR